MYYQGILKPPIKLIGAKTRNRRTLYERFPSHKTYVEPFLGTGGVLLGKPKVELEIVNDFDPYVINFYRYVQLFQITLFTYIQKQLERITEENAKTLFEEWKVRLVSTQSPFMRAANYYLINKHCFNGIIRFNEKGECNSSWGKATTGRGLLTKEWMNLINSRIKETYLFCADGLDLIEDIVNQPPGEDLFMFVDPPYRDCQTVYRGKKFSDADQVKLRDLLKAAKFKWMLTLNDDQFVREIYNDFNIYSHQINYNCSNTPAGRGLKPEVIITNYIKE